MPSVSVGCLLKPEQPERPDTSSNASFSDVVNVVCTFGEHDLVYPMRTRLLERVVNLDCTAPARAPVRWGVFASNEIGINTLPLGDNFTRASLRGTNMRLLYKTAGLYHNSVDANAELRKLPKRSGKKSEVVTTDDEEAKDAEGSTTSDDTEYDSDGQPKPKTSKTVKKSKKRAAKKRNRKPYPENLQYRREIIEAQQEDTTRVLTVTHLGDELCAVLAQMFRALTESQSRESSRCELQSETVFFYTSPAWLGSVADQAAQAGNDMLASVAREMQANTRAHGFTARVDGADYVLQPPPSSKACARAF